MTSVLVTGRTGRVVVRAAQALAVAGFTPFVFDNFSNGHRWAAKWDPLVERDLADGPLIRESLRKYDVRAVRHFLCYSSSMVGL